LVVIKIQMQEHYLFRLVTLIKKDVSLLLLRLEPNLLVSNVKIVMKVLKLNVSLTLIILLVMLTELIEVTICLTNMLMKIVLN
jgi:hypothetical protein